MQLAEQSAAQKRKKNTDARDAHICQRFNHLFNEKRIRMDDAIKKIADELFMEPTTVEKVIKRTTSNKPKAVTIN